MMTAVSIIRRIARSAGYSEEDIRAGFEFDSRKEGRTNPPGEFDKAGRFEPSERTNAVLSARTPSRSWPFSRMRAARTANHCAEVFGARALHVKRIAKALQKLNDLDLTDSAHGALQASAVVGHILKRVGPPKDG